MQQHISHARAETMLFLLVSADGKISSGPGEVLDPDRDWRRVHGVKEGLAQYHQIEQTTDLCSLITGKIVAKIRPADPTIPMPDPNRPPFLHSVVIDSKPWMTLLDVQRTLVQVKHLYVVTSNATHPAFELEGNVPNLTIIHYPGRIDFSDLFVRLKQEYGIGRVTIQSGGTLNAVLVRAGLIDHVLLVVAPLLVGGKDTPSLIDGVSLQCEQDLCGLKALRLTRCQTLEDSYVRLEYDVIQETVIDAKQEYP